MEDTQDFHPLSASDTQLLTEAVFFAIRLLQDRCYINQKENDSHSSMEVRTLGSQIADTIIQISEQLCFREEEEFICEHEVFEDIRGTPESSEEVEGELSQKVTSQPLTDTPISSEISSSSQSTSSLYEDEAVLIDFIPIADKIRAVNLHREHPNWTLKTLQRNGCSRLIRMDERSRWKKDIENGGTRYDKLSFIYKWVYQRFLDNREVKKPVFFWDLKVWAMQAASQFLTDGSFTFSASDSWVIKFKNNYRIRMRKVTRFIKPAESRSAMDLVDVARIFQDECSRIVPQYNLDFVLNTDQTGCEYRVNVQRVLAEKGSKRIEVQIGDMNKVTYTYTAQYSITASGKLLPRVFICLQESKGNFGPVTQKHIDEMVERYNNVHIVCSKSGKLSTELFKDYIDNILKPYVTEDFLLILDSWGGQTSEEINNKFHEFNVSHLIKTIPPGCTKFAQPCDVYFYRQVKIIIKKLQNATVLKSEAVRQLSTRSDSVKIHSLIHNQLSAPIFREMLQYAWYAARLILNRSVFFNVNQVCFCKDVLKQKCYMRNCAKQAIIRCSWCRRFICFNCFYDDYHPANCEHFE